MDFHWHLQWLELYLALSEYTFDLAQHSEFPSIREILNQLKEGNLEAFLLILQHPDERVRVHGVYTLQAFLEGCLPLQRLGYLKAFHSVPPSRYLPAFQDLQRQWEGEKKSATRSQAVKTPFSSTCRELPRSAGCICWMSIESFWILSLLPYFPGAKGEPHP